MKKRLRSNSSKAAMAVGLITLLGACSSVDTSTVTRTQPATEPGVSWKAKISVSPDYKAETDYIAQRRRALGLCSGDPTVALCFAGGGLRAATIQLGALQGLEEKGILEKADYLSSVSGGSYIASWYVSHLLPRGAQSVKSRKTLFHGGVDSYHSDPAMLLQLGAGPASQSGAVDELMERRGFVLGKWNMHLPWLIPAHLATLPLNYVFDLGLHFKPVRGKFNWHHPALLYENAIRRTYLTEPEWLVPGQTGFADGLRSPSHEMRLNEINPPNHPAPYLVINAAQSNSPSEGDLWTHRALHFEFSRNAVGGPFIGYVHPDNFGYPVQAVKRNPDGTGEVVMRPNSIPHLPFTTKPLRLSTAVAASGAAFDPNGGGKASGSGKEWPEGSGEIQPEVQNDKHFYFKFLSQLLNVHLRQQNRNFAMEPPGASNGKWNSIDFAKDRYREVTKDRIMPSSTSNTLVLTDGGHFDNLGIYAMMQRPSVKEVWAFDVPQDGGYEFKDWFQIVKLLKVKGWVISPHGQQRLFEPPAGVETKAPPVVKATEKNPLGGPDIWTESPVFAFNAKQAKTGRSVRIYLVKSSYRVNDGEDIGLKDGFQVYRESGPTGKKFPHTSTGNVSFTEQDFTWYRNLGRVLAHHLAKERTN
jgi:hypothetical protein